jgi:hypothetical protein
MACRVYLHPALSTSYVPLYCGARWDKERRRYFATNPYSIIALTDHVPIARPAGLASRDEKPAPPRLWMRVLYTRTAAALEAGARYSHEYQCWYAPDPRIWRRCIRDGIACKPTQRYMDWAMPLLRE